MSDKIRVAVRVRPLIPRETNENLPTCWSVENNRITQVDSKGQKLLNSSFTFDKIFRNTDSNYHVFGEIGKPIVDSVMQGFNGTMFAYGQTSSGKTYTMMGAPPKIPGVIQFTVDSIFDIIDNTPDREFLLRISYMEIYNETISDLLSGEGKNLSVRENADGQVFVADLSEITVNRKDDIMMHMKSGEKLRHFGETNMNDRSSRSHTIFRMIIESRLRDQDIDEAVKVSHLNIVDLAGSERAGQTGATGERFREGIHINTSLSVLGLVIGKLSKGDASHINYRDSKLTRILQNSLGGNARTAIICTITPASVDQTICTLRFAKLAKEIKNKPIVNEVLSDAALLKRYSREINELQMKLKETQVDDMKEKLKEKESTIQEKNNTIEELKEKIKLLQEKFVVSKAPYKRKPDNIRKLRRETWAAPLSSLAFLERSHALGAISEETPESPWSGKSLRLSEYNMSDISFQETSLEEFKRSLLIEEKRKSRIGAVPELLVLENDEIPDQVFDSSPDNIYEKYLKLKSDYENLLKEYSCVKNKVDNCLFEKNCAGEFEDKVNKYSHPGENTRKLSKNQDLESSVLSGDSHGYTLETSPPCSTSAIYSNMKFSFNNTKNLLLEIEKQRKEKCNEVESSNDSCSNRTSFFSAQDVTILPPKSDVAVMTDEIQDSQCHCLIKLSTSDRESQMNVMVPQSENVNSILAQTDNANWTHNPDDIGSKFSASACVFASEGLHCDLLNNDSTETDKVEVKNVSVLTDQAFLESKEAMLRVESDCLTELKLLNTSAQTDVMIESSNLKDMAVNTSAVLPEVECMTSQNLLNVSSQTLDVIFASADVTDAAVNTSAMSPEVENIFNLDVTNVSSQTEDLILASTDVKDAAVNTSAVSPEVENIFNLDVTSVSSKTEDLILASIDVKDVSINTDDLVCTVDVLAKTKKSETLNTSVFTDNHALSAVNVMVPAKDCNLLCDDTRYTKIGTPGRNTSVQTEMCVTCDVSTMAESPVKELKNVSIITDTDLITNMQDVSVLTEADPYFRSVTTQDVFVLTDNCVGMETTQEMSTQTEKECEIQHNSTVLKDLNSSQNVKYVPFQCSKTEQMQSIGETELMDECKYEIGADQDGCISRGLPVQELKNTSILNGQNIGTNSLCSPEHSAIAGKSWEVQTTKLQKKEYKDVSLLTEINFGTELIQDAFFLSKLALKELGHSSVKIDEESALTECQKVEFKNVSVLTDKNSGTEALHDVSVLTDFPEKEFRNVSLITDMPEKELHDRSVMTDRRGETAILQDVSVLTELLEKDFKSTSVLTDRNFQTEMMHDVSVFSAANHLETSTRDVSMITEKESVQDVSIMTYVTGIAIENALNTMNNKNTLTQCTSFSTESFKSCTKNMSLTMDGLTLQPEEICKLCQSKLKGEVTSSNMDVEMNLNELSNPMGYVSSSAECDTTQKKVTSHLMELTCETSADQQQKCNQNAKEILTLKSRLRELQKEFDDYKKYAEAEKEGFDQQAMIFSKKLLEARDRNLRLKKEQFDLKKQLKYDTNQMKDSVSKVDRESQTEVQQLKLSEENEELKKILEIESTNRFKSLEEELNTLRKKFREEKVLLEEDKEAAEEQRELIQKRYVKANETIWSLREKLITAKQSLKEYEKQGSACHSLTSSGSQTETESKNSSTISEHQLKRKLEEERKRVKSLEEELRNQKHQIMHYKTEIRRIQKETTFDTSVANIQSKESIQDPAAALKAIIGNGVGSGIVNSIQLQYLSAQLNMKEREITQLKKRLYILTRRCELSKENSKSSAHENHLVDAATSPQKPTDLQKPWSPGKTKAPPRPPHTTKDGDDNCKVQ